MHIYDSVDRLAKTIIDMDKNLLALREAMRKFVNDFDRSIEGCYHNVTIKVIGTKPITIFEKEYGDVN